ncbi:MAG: GntR family transcriptional regulator [Ancrocorticia sp.]
MTIVVDALNTPSIFAVESNKGFEAPRYQETSGRSYTMDNYEEQHPGRQTDTLEPIYREAGITSLFDDLKKAGFNPTTEVLEYTVAPAGAEIASLLDCDDNDEVVHIKRLRFSRGVPLAILHTTVLASKAPNQDGLTEAGLYSLLRDKGSIPASGSQLVGARCAATEEAELLQVSGGTAVLTVERTIYADNDEVIALEEDVYEASQYFLTFSLRAE